MGCGASEDVEWWATLMNNDEPPEPYNFTCHAVDIDGSKLAQIPNLSNIFKNNNSFDADYLFPVPVDFIYAHDCLQYSTNPLATLAKWNSYMNVNGMLVLAVPQDTYIYNNRLVITNHSATPYSFNVLNLMYMLACNGFDCNDAYFYRKENSPWLYAAVYASEFDPDLPKLSWYELAERKLVNASIVNSVNKYGFARLSDLVVTWLDKNFYKIDN